LDTIQLRGLGIVNPLPARDFRVEAVMNLLRSGSRFLALLLSFAALSAPAHAQQKLLGLGCGLGTVTISGNVVHAGIDLPGIVGTELVLEFDSVQHLTKQNLGICAKAMDPLTLLDVMSRLPDGGLTGLLQLPLPIVISVDPPVLGGLSFTNTYRAEIHTEMLGYTLLSPYRLYKSPHNGTFYDVTNLVAQGSVRTRGSTGGFSDFIVVLDTVPSPEHAADKYDYLAARIQDPAIGIRLRTNLAADLAASRAAFYGHDYVTALAKLDAFTTRVRDKAGVGIPNVWRSARDVDNIAGDLLGYAESLRFSIQRTAAGG
jgi:hypothetical protein